MDSMFILALNSSLILGLIHGVNPCGHSWVILTPFVVGSRSGKSVAAYTAAFISGTTLACAMMGYLLGFISGSIPQQYFKYMEYSVGGIIIVMGLILMVKPSFLHSHDHCDTGPKKSGLFGLFSIGFVNMIIPCPTLSLMYGYGLNAKSALAGSAVFLVYAVTTGIAISAVIFLIYKLNSIVHKMYNHKIENVLMRSAGLVTAAFGAMTLYLG